MVTVRSRVLSGIAAPGDERKMEVLGKGFVSEYELSREERIKENQERMQKLGILDLSQKLVALSSANGRVSKRRSSVACSPLPFTEPVRRSSRLQNATPVSYCEMRQLSDGVKKTKGRIIIRDGVRPEIYTEEHEKLLGSTERAWTLFVDGYGVDGKRIYDSFKGKTCHQCRQKTLGHRTQCSQCNMVQGQFCGDCLYMRYGENVLEANENPNWICPGCRGICNCSLCRQAKGWAPTGPLYRKISSLGYKSVAHYLIQSRRHDAVPDENSGTKSPVSAKRSLPFSDIDAFPEDEDKSITLPTEADDEIGGDVSDGPQTSEAPLVAAQLDGQIQHPPIHDAKRADLEHDQEVESHSTAKAATTETVQEITTGTPNPSDSSHIASPPTRGRPKTTKKRTHVETPDDSIAGRLRQRRAAH